jgi:hypothetical protein
VIVFHATSGNVAHASVIAQGNGATVVDIGWLNGATPEDIQEFDNWFDPIIMRITGVDESNLQTLRVDDPAARAALALQLCKPETSQ